MTDPFDLERFVDAQQPVYARVLSELRNGHKTSHWMWFVFPQIAGLGGSPKAIRYAIASLAEARAYLDHPVLGPRLRECCEILAGLEGRTAEAIFGYPDVLKLRSSLTFFSRAAGQGDSVFDALLAKYYEGKADPQTLALIA
ncbi:DUF1810 domain-containing protein [Ciceribacter selenitireducens]|uniref:DUF1810 domain-containing protein n=1 Tax=Ciceribacter selenitireducens TaxID=448181 RepID=UPI00048B8C55|nr:DUF1810 domain-containing protein [Ciceribacter selenitireducens]